MRSTFAARLFLLNGHFFPRHRTITFEPAGALTRKSRSRTPLRVIVPEIRITGKGLIRLGPDAAAVGGGARTVQTLVAGVESRLPASSTARTAKLCVPIASSP